MKIFMNYYADGACPYNRILLPARFCGDELKDHGIEVTVGEGAPEGHDVYWFHGLPNNVLLTEMAKAKRKGARFVWSMDDDWPSIPEWNPNHPTPEALAMYDVAKGLADLIVCSTPALGETFKGLDVAVAPNLLDLEKYPDHPYAEVEGGGRNYVRDVVPPIKIMWAGGVTHREDLRVVEGPLAELLSARRGKAVGLFFGAMPPGELLRKYLHAGCLYQPLVTFAAYHNTVVGLRPDVYLAPLAEVPFNLSKSNLRVIEGWALGAVPVATPWGEYGCVRDGWDGFLPATPAEWVECLKRLADDHRLRLQMAAEGRVRVEQEYSWQSERCRRPWVEAFLKAAGG